MKPINVSVLNSYIHVQNTQRNTIDYIFDFKKLYYINILRIFKNRTS